MYVRAWARQRQKNEQQKKKKLKFQKQKNKCNNQNGFQNITEGLSKMGPFREDKRYNKKEAWL